MARVSPRKPNQLTDKTAARLGVAKARADAAQAELKAVVREALTEGSVRQVAAVLGISPTTVQAWSKAD
jgi:hypothetical protein